jgi:hypothetical protein
MVGVGMFVAAVREVVVLLFWRSVHEWVGKGLVVIMVNMNMTMNRGVVVMMMMMVDVDGWSERGRS